jgi:molecular chaperone HscA
MAARALTEAQVEAERILAATMSALAADADLLDARERSAIDAAMAAVRQRLGGTDRHALQAAVAALNRATAEFAARRMDRGVAAALTGRRVDMLARD